MERKCPACGMKLPEEAAFCPYCLKPLIEKREVRPPHPRHTGRIFAGGVFLALALLISAVLVFRPARTPGDAAAESETAETAPAILAQKTSSTAAGEGQSEQAPDDSAAAQEPGVWDNGGAELRYQAEDGVTYRVLASLRSGAEPCPGADSGAENTIAENERFAYPSQLYAISEDGRKNLREEFMENVSDCTISAIPEDGAAAMECSLPHQDGDFPYALWMSDVYYEADCGTNRLVWTLEMKNGDVLHLYQTITIHKQQRVKYSYTDEPMQTLEELQALLDRVADELGEDAFVTIQLPPVCYEGGLTLQRRAFAFVGTNNGTQSTTFTGPCVVETQTPQNAAFSSICFEGNGGTGLLSSAATELLNCRFSGWDTGAMVEDGGWISVSGCTFEKNGVGFEINTEYSSFFNGDISRSDFLENETAVRALSIPGLKTLCFTETIFEGNETDIDNLTGREFDLSGAQFR